MSKNAEFSIQFVMKNIIYFHDRMTEKVKMTAGIRNIGLLESAIAAPFQTWGGEDVYPSVYEKAAYICYNIAKNHPFVDGNKRTALHSMLVFLYLNNMVVTASLDDVEHMILEVAASSDNQAIIDKLIKWLQDNTEINEINFKSR